MEFASVKDLCQHLISSGIQRCRASEQLCRLSIVLDSSRASDSVHISISDTGVGSLLEEFQVLKFSRDSAGAEKWDGIICVRTTNISDKEVHHFLINLKESESARRLTQQPSSLKNGAKFSGTEVCLSTFESLDVLLAEIHCFCQEMLILNVPSVAIEVKLQHGDVPGAQKESVFLSNDPIPYLASNIERLKLGLEEYVLKHGYSLDANCEFCFPTRKSLKCGIGMASAIERQRNSELFVDVVIVMSEIDPTSTCFRTRGAQTKVIYFKDFAPHSVSPSVLKALSGVDWKSYGLILGNLTSRDHYAFVEWEDLPPYSQIHIVLHSYHEQVMQLAGQKTQAECTILKKAIRSALADLKDKHAGVLLSAHATKILSHAPDLARTIAGLVISSGDLDFQEECFTLLGLHSEEDRGDLVETIEKKIVSVIEMNDQKPHGAKDTAPLLFEVGKFQELESQQEQYELCEEYHCPMDF